MSKALYILDYKLNSPVHDWHDYQTRGLQTGSISIEAESYDEAVEKAIQRLPKERGEQSNYGIYGRSSTRYRHIFMLKDCLDQQHATYIPNSQEFNIDNSISSVAIASHRSIL